MKERKQGKWVNKWKTKRKLAKRIKIERKDHIITKDGKTKDAKNEDNKTNKKILFGKIGKGLGKLNAFLPYHLIEGNKKELEK